MSLGWVASLVAAVQSLLTDASPPALPTLPLHDALPISTTTCRASSFSGGMRCSLASSSAQYSMSKASDRKSTRLNSAPCNLVCRLLREKKKEQPRGG